MDNAASTARAMSERLAQHLSAAPPVSREEIETVVRAVFATLHGDLSSRDTELLAEVEELGRTIAAAKAEIAALRVDDITVSQIPSATDELDAIVSHTAAATNAILESCEALDTLGASMKGKQADILAEATTRIYEACSFQDITGQRIGKVVGTLQAIEAKVAHIVEAFGDPSAAPLHNAASTHGEAALLNGPQLPMTAMDQSEIDRLLASFE